MDALPSKDLLEPHGFKAQPKRHSMTTRFLLTVISSFYFDGDKTLNDLHEEIALDASKLYSVGIDVSCLEFIFKQTGYLEFQIHMCKEPNVLHSSSATLFSETSANPLRLPDSIVVSIALTHAIFVIVTSQTGMSGWPMRNGVGRRGIGGFGTPSNLVQTPCWQFLDWSEMAFGFDFSASGLVLLCKKLYFNDGTLNRTLRYAYANKKFFEMVPCQWQTYGYWLVASQETWYENVSWAKFQLT